MALLVLIPFIVYTPVLGQGVSTQSSSISTTTLQTYSTAKTVTAAANHVVQPFGKYTSTPSGTLYAANAFDNVTISLISGFPTFSSYQANSTEQLWASGCQKEQDIEKGATLVISYIGTSCGVAPTLKLSFSPLPVNSTSCSLSWTHESYSWCGDSGFSYSSGTLTVVPPSATFDEDPMIVQANGGTCSGAVSSCTLGSGLTFTGGNTLIVGEGANQSSQTSCGNFPTMNAPSVTAGLSFTQEGSTQTAFIAGSSFCTGSSIWVASITSTITSQTLTANLASSTSITSLDGIYVEASGVVTTGIVTSSGTGTGTAGALTSQTFSSPSVLVAMYQNTVTNTYTAGSTFTAITPGGGGGGQYSTTAASPNTWPITIGSSTTWVGVGVALAGLDNALFVLQVQSTSSGMILMPTINNAATTITSLSTLTATCCTTNTWTVIGVPWGGNIFAAWSGATTWIQNTLDPTQTITYSSFAVSTLTSTLTASFSSATGGGSAPSSPDYTWLLLLPFILLAIVIVLRRR